MFSRVFHKLYLISYIILAVLIMTSAITTPVKAADKQQQWNNIEDYFLLLKNTKKKSKRIELYNEVVKRKLTSYADALDAYKRGVLALYEGKLVIYENSLSNSGEKFYPLIYAESGEKVFGSDGNQVLMNAYTDMLKAKRPDRKTISDIIKALNLKNEDDYKRREAIIAAGERIDSSALPTLLELQTEDSINADYINESIAVIELNTSDDRDTILKAINSLAESGTIHAQVILDDYLKEHKDLTQNVQTAITKAKSSINWKQKIIRFIRNSFAGLSLGSILILLALGLSVIFGLMGVINMAHGEFMMLGAFTTYVVCEIFKKYMPPLWFDYYFIFAIPCAFIISALVGYLCELIIIKKLYGRPYETILATWGLSLVLIQTVRLIFGDTLSLTPPSWLSGGWEVTPDLILPINRIFIIIFSTTCVFLFFLLIQKTKLGLLVRATTQDRPTADSCGVPVRQIDGLTFAIGSGLAGLAGCAVPLFDKINPSMGQSYIVDSFMVVVLGGVGKLAGIILGGLGLGFVSKYLEPISGAVYGKVIVLMLIVMFLQWRPSGLFPARGRSIDD